MQEADRLIIKSFEFLDTPMLQTYIATQVWFVLIWIMPVCFLVIPVDPFDPLTHRTIQMCPTYDPLVEVFFLKVM